MTNKIVIIYWQDSFSMDAWQLKDTAIQNAKKPMTCKTVGFVVSEKGGSVTVCHTVNAENQVCGTMQIPKRCIVKIKKIK